MREQTQLLFFPPIFVLVFILLVLTFLSALQVLLNYVPSQQCNFDEVVFNEHPESFS